MLFNLLVWWKGYHFKKVKTTQQIQDFQEVYDTQGFVFPEDVKKAIKAIKSDSIKFIAYHKNTPVGTIALANPQTYNLPFEMLGVDEAGEHFEIQSLVVKKEFRDSSQLVMLGLFRSIYVYSRRQGIKSWIAVGMRSVYLTMHRYCKNMQDLKVDFTEQTHLLTKYGYQNNVFDTCFTMQVSAFSPTKIFKLFLKHRFRNLQKSLLTSKGSLSSSQN
jgi:hypothetical protein